MSKNTPKRPVIITQWALDSYLDLKHNNVFTDQEYYGTLRPDAVLLENYDGRANRPAKFDDNKFWSIASGRAGKVSDGYKMKWHNIGPGNVQLRLGVGLIDGKAWLCEAYVKDSSSTDKRKMARLRVHLRRIRQGQVITRGRLS
jgi:hypothetical protein